MFRRRVSAALAAAALVCGAAGAQDAKKPMPAFPEAGDAATATMPAINGLRGAGQTAVGVAPARIEKIVRAIKAAADVPLRGKLEQALFAKYSRSVVLIVTPAGLGSGSVIDKDGTILTNWHVVENLKTVGVIFKPLSGDLNVKEADAVEAKVLRVDQIADLALVKVAAVPSDVKVVALGDHTKLAVGADVHAIGHPHGETWSYTKGIVSQIRANYEWSYERGGVQHKADVVQTQTPINPGNSGGPLLDDQGRLVGVATFGRATGTSINFAIASSEVKRFVEGSGDRLAPSAQVAAETKSGAPCEPVQLASQRAKDGKSTIHILDTNCNGKKDTIVSIPDKKGDQIMLGIDANENGVLEAIYVDDNGDLKFDTVYFDTNEDGTTDLVGHDLDENLNPGRIEAA